MIEKHFWFIGFNVPMRISFTDEQQFIAGIQAINHQMRQARPGDRLAEVAHVHGTLFVTVTNLIAITDPR